MKKLWLVKDIKGRVLGPYSEEEIISYIQQKRFTGEEHYCSYPSGRWNPLSVHAGFYEQILKSLSETPESHSLDTTKSNSFTEDKTPLEATVILPKPKQKKKKKKKQVKIKVSPWGDSEEEDEDEFIDMEDEQQQLFQTLKKALVLPLFIGGALALAFFTFFYSKPQEGMKQVRLLGIQKKRPPWSQAELDKKFKQILFYYTKDEISFYLKTQAQAVQILEADPHNLQAYVRLCLSYLELWPFAHQDTQDKKVLLKTLDEVNKRDKGGVYAGICNSINAFVKNEHEQALMIIDSSIHVLPSKSPIFFYYVKAKILKELNRKDEARNYLQTLHNVFPQWIAPYILDAQMHYDSGQYSLAMRKYQQALSVYPAHHEAGLMLGVLEYRHLKNIPKSQNRLTRILTQLSEIVSPSVLLESYKVLMDISIKQQDEKQALAYAKKAYALDSSDNELAVKITQWGGRSHLKPTTDSGRQLIYQGDLLVSRGDCQKAQEHYKKAYSLKPQKNALAATKMARCLWKQGFTSQAIQWLKKSISADPKLVESYFLLVDYLSSLYDFEGAQKILESVHRRNPSKYELYKNYALLAFRKKQYKVAVTYAEQSLKFYISDVEVYVLLSKAYRTLGEYNKAYVNAQKAIQEDINSTPAQIAYALALGSGYGFHRGEQYLQKMQKTFPSALDYPQALGEYYFEEGKHKQAIETFQSLLQQNSEFQKAHLYMGRAYQALAAENESKEFYEQAIKGLLKASLLDTSNPEPLFYLGQLYLEINYYKDAIKYFGKVLRINPNYPLIHYYMGRSYFLQGDSDDLDKALKEARVEIEKNPNLSLAYALAGDVYKRKAISPSSGDGRESVGYIQRSNYELCTKEYQKAIKLQPHLEYYIQLIICYRGSGDFDSAIQIANQVKNDEGTSGYPEIYYQLGQIYEIKKDYELAKKNYKEYFTLNPRAPNRQRIEKRLEGYNAKTK